MYSQTKIYIKICYFICFCYNDMIFYLNILLLTTFLQCANLDLMLVNQHKKLQSVKNITKHIKIQFLSYNLCLKNFSIVLFTC